MSTELHWVDSYGGPLLLLPHELLPYWFGTDGPYYDADDEEESQTSAPVVADFRCEGMDSEATDYDRACDVVNDVATIEIGPGHGILLNSGVKHSAALYHTGSDSAILIERLYGAGDGLERELDSIHREEFSPPELFLDLQDGRLLLTHSAADGEYLVEFPEHPEFALPPGRYSLATMHYTGDHPAELVLHWLQREGEAGQTCDAERSLPAATSTTPTAIASADEPLFQVQLGGKIGFINRRGELVIEPRYTHIADFEEGMAPFQKEGKYGYINKQGETVIQPAYRYANSFSDGIALVSVNEQESRYINHAGEEPFPCDYDQFGHFDEGRARVSNKVKEDPVANNDSPYRTGFIDPAGKLVIPCIYVSASRFFEGLANVILDKKKLVIDLIGNIQFEFDRHHRGLIFSEGLASYWYSDENDFNRREVGFYDLTGKIVIGPTSQWSIAGNFSEGLGWVLTKDEHYGYIDRSGQIVIGPNLLKAKPFSEGLAAVSKTKGKHGFIDASGEFVIEPRFSETFSFKDGLARVRIAGKYGYIDRTGQMIWEPSR